MGSCAKQTFTNISQQQFSCIVQQAQSNFGISIGGNSGTASKSGVTVAWNYDPNAQTLDIQCTDAPFFLGCGTINSKIHDIVDSCQ
jgi:hypothetical protein